MRYLLLGPLQIAGETTLTITAPKIETLFATLLIRANRAVSTDELIGELWGEQPPRRVRSALHVYVSQIRKRFTADEPGAAVLRTHGQGYLLEVDESRLDVTDLQREHALGQSLVDRDPHAALAAFTRAAALFRGPVLGHIRNGLVVGGFGRWADELRLECLEAVARGSLVTGRHREVIGDLAKWAEEYPLHEAFREQLMVALYRSGRRAEALAVFQSARRVLREELGLEPRESMRRLQSHILGADRDLSLAG
ncbi:AfsR/SARP family transcriptional regulator [Actinokineospora auranticolor]|uniref:DNA-binding SARP family transcriptional activator n=1 Tax=Actinokineospora auranticolor TaxID=155976 RepID=A0A2S6H1Z0_9PSEU|nr:AfsR/SARP family transcriptional regulator [Actinokineospora auranticolor]PPK71426.1 DNA-binding SARP family transcriptional activator [Actinokineospora auranticolor]